ncbi:MAG: hypothetical protein GY816_23085 [Cytophagales bacterium]|nr:hypothetical protein [Cytophagales bacterium]
MCKEIFVALVLFSSLTSSAQSGGIKIQMKNGEETFTNYVLFSNGYGWNEEAYVRINDKKGSKLRMVSVDHVEGYDQKKDYRYILPIRPNGGELVWGERMFASDKVAIYYTDFNSNSWSRSVLYKSRNFYYTFENSTMTKMKYGNLKRDIGNIEIPSSHLKKGNGVRIAQIIMYTAGAALIIHGSSKFLEGSENNELGDPEDASLNLHPNVFIGVALVNIPYFLNSLKQKHFRNTLEAVK